MFCKSCGNKINESSKFCTSCGAVATAVVQKNGQEKKTITEMTVSNEKNTSEVLEKPMKVEQPVENLVSESNSPVEASAQISRAKPDINLKNPIPAELFTLIMNYCSKGNLTEPEIRLLKNEAVYSNIEWERIQSIIDIELEKIKKRKKRERNKRIISNSLFIVTLLFIVSLFGFYFYAKKYQNKDYFWIIGEWVENKSATENQPNSALAIEPLAQYVTPDFCDYVVSSIYSSWGIQNLKVENLYDNSNETPWIEGSPGNGAEEYIVLQFPESKFPPEKKSIYLKGIRLYNGFCKSDSETWLNYSRVKKVLVYKNEKLQWDFPVIDTYSEQTVLFKTIRTDKIEINPGDNIKIKIADTYKGRRYAMATAISELVPILEY